MIDLHCHMLPGIDDGAPDLETSLAMARIAVADGIVTTACTPHIYPGVYNNTGAGIHQAIGQLQQALDAHQIPLKLVAGADAHVAPELPAKLRSGDAPSLSGSRYFLLEPPHHVAPPRFEEFVFNLLAGGFVLLITHPERLSWIEDHYATFCALVDQGAWLQVTAGSLTGRFGSRPRYWGERLLGEGRVHVLATDSHGVKRRPPLLEEGRAAAERWVGLEESWHLVRTRPAGILADFVPSAQPAVPCRDAPDGARRSPSPKKSFWGPLFGAGKRR